MERKMKTGLILPWEAYSSLDGTTERRMCLIVVRNYEIRPQRAGAAELTERIFLEVEDEAFGFSKHGNRSEFSVGAPVHLTERTAFDRLLRYRIDVTIGKTPSYARFRRGDLAVGSVDDLLEDAFSRMRGSAKKWNIRTINDLVDATLSFFIQIWREAIRSAQGTRNVRKDRQRRMIRLPSSVTEGDNGRRPIASAEQFLLPRESIGEDGAPPVEIRRYATIQPYRGDYLYKSPAEVPDFVGKGHHDNDLHRYDYNDMDRYFAQEQPGPGELDNGSRTTSVVLLLDAVIGRLEKHKSKLARDLAAIFRLCRSDGSLYRETSKKLTFERTGIAARLGWPRDRVDNALRLLSSSRQGATLFEVLELNSLEEELHTSWKTRVATPEADREI